MRTLRSLISPLVMALAVLAGPGTAAAQTIPTPTCAWQFEWGPTGLANWLIPDAGSHWRYMPIDPQWQKVTINGSYPQARFFSLALYEGLPTATALGDHLYDAQIAPDPGSINPFASPDASGRATGRPRYYTMHIVRSGAKGGNDLQLHANGGWLVYRLYLPNAGIGTTGGVPFPSISVTDANGQTRTLPPCPVSNRQSELAALQPIIIPPVLENPQPQPPVPDHVLFAPVPKPPARLFQNPDNKYLISYFMSDYDPARILVVHGKMPGFPDTFNAGTPIDKPAPSFDTVQMRYWSMCFASFVSPIPVEGCAVDARTPTDERGFYTVVISNDALRPDWLPSQVAWIPWGDEDMVPKAIVQRNTLASPDFTQTAQAAVDQGCGVAFNFPTFPTQEEIAPAAQCTAKIMGSYYPTALWCDREDFKSGGWAKCVTRAKRGRNW